MPLRTGEQTIGVVTLTRQSPDHPFTAGEVELAQQIVACIGPAIANEGLIEARDRAERLAAVREDELRSVFDDAPSPAAIVSLEPATPGRFLRVNGAFCRLTGYREEQLLDMAIMDLVWNNGRDLRDVIGSTRAGMSARRREGHLRHAGGALIEVSIVASPIERTDESSRCLVHVEDLTGHKRILEQLETRALYDELTGLANRRLLLDRLKMALRRLQRDGVELTLVYVDVDRFKDINDSFGHEAGDQVLVEVGRRLEAAVRAVDTVARVAGDEFVVLCPQADSVTASRIVERIRARLVPPIRLRNGDVSVTASIGVTVATSANLRIDELLHQADTAMYTSKRQGGDRWRLYDDALRNQMTRRHMAEREVRDALVNDRFVLHYQPVIDLRDGRIVGTEALLRLAHPTRGLLVPGDFIDVAEESDLIIHVGQRVLREACRQAGRWNRRFGPLDMAVNVSGRQAGRATVIDQVVAAMADSDLDPAHLCLEMTERVYIEGGVLVTDWFRELAHCGVHLALDDFGTGYSSMTQLRRLPIDTVKIDRSFVADLGVAHDSDAIVQAISWLAHELDLQIVAEGVETGEQLRVLRSIACDRAQGFLFHRPLPAAEITALLAAQARPEP